MSGTRGTINERVKASGEEAERQARKQPSDWHSTSLEAQAAINRAKDPSSNWPEAPLSNQKDQLLHDWVGKCPPGKPTLGSEGAVKGARTLPAMMQAAAARGTSDIVGGQALDE